MASSPGGHYRPEKRSFIIAMVKAISENKAELGTKPPKKGKGK